MKSDKKKDALTDLVDGVASESAADSSATLHEGEAVTPSGDVVTLGVDDEKLTQLARKLLKAAKERKFKNK